MRRLEARSEGEVAKTKTPAACIEGRTISISLISDHASWKVWTVNTDTKRASPAKESKEKQPDSCSFICASRRS
eukprot:350184-Pelagomonas_calceolata.AAC.3